MKLLILINLLIVSLNSFGQEIHSIKKTWIDKNNRALIIQDKNLLWEKDMWLTEYDYRISHDTLFMIAYRYTTPKEFPTERPFHILKLMNDSLVLEYNKLWMGEVTEEKDTLIYIDSAKIYNNNVEFKKILFSISYLSGYTPRIKLEIHKNGDVYFWDKNVDTIFYYKKLPKEKMDSLRNIMKRSRIENMPTNQIGVIIDNPNYFLTIVDRQKKHKYAFYGIPYLDMEFIVFMYHILEQIKTNSITIKYHKFIE